MNAENFFIIIAANIRMHYKYTLLPGIALLFVIPFVYGTANLDCLQSADCLERMAALIGIPMFTPLIRQEHSRGLYETIAFRQVSLKFIVFLRIVLSVIGSILLILVFALYMRFCGCSFPLFPYAFRTLAASMALGIQSVVIYVHFVFILWYKPEISEEPSGLSQTEFSFRLFCFLYVSAWQWSVLANPQ